jgi:hypothetical protein
VTVFARRDEPAAPWWAAFGPAETQVKCGESMHTLRWADGALAAADHQDAEGELVLAALGGDTTPCVSLIQSWGQRSDDLAVLAVGPRSAADQLAVTPGWLDQEDGGGGGFFGPVASLTSRRIVRARLRAVARGQTSYGSAGGMRSSAGFRPSPAPMRRPGHRPARLMRGWSEPPHPRAELVELLALGLPFQLRLSAAVAQAWSADGQHAGRAGQVRPALTAALWGRAAPAAAGWLGIDASQIDATVHDGPGWGEAEWAARAAGGSGHERRLRLALPVGWLAAVWAPGLAVVGDHLVVAVQQAAWPTAQVLAIRQPGGTPVELSIKHSGSDWAVTS